MISRTEFVDSELDLRRLSLVSCIVKFIRLCLSLAQTESHMFLLLQQKMMSDFDIFEDGEFLLVSGKQLLSVVLD